MTQRARILFNRIFDIIDAHIHLLPQVELIAVEAARSAKAGQIGTQATLAGPTFGPNLKHLDHDSVVLPWERLFGSENTRLVPFRRRPSILQHLCEVLDVDVCVFGKDRPDELAAVALVNAVNQAWLGADCTDLDLIIATEPLSIAADLATELQDRSGDELERVATAFENELAALAP